MKEVMKQSNLVSCTYCRWEADGVCHCSEAPSALGLDWCNHWWPSDYCKCMFSAGLKAFDESRSLRNQLSRAKGQITTLRKQLEE